MRKIKKCNIGALAIILLLTLFFSTSVFADDTSLGRTPEGVFPINEDDVIMESEEITVDLEKNSVECIFVFHNTGKSKNVYIGFPGKLYDEEDGLTDAANLELKNFKTFVKGKGLPVTREKSTKNINGGTSDTSLKYSEYFTFSVPFKTDEKVTVRNTYDFTPTYDSMGSVYSGYVLKTGAMWKDKIGSAKVTFKLGNIKPYQIEKLKPGGFKFIGNNIVWERTNFEPNYDLQIEYNTYRYSAENLSNITDNVEELKQEIKREIDNYNNVKELGDKGKTDELLALYSKAVKNKDFILATYIKSYLPSDKISDEISTLGDISVEYRNNNDYYVNCDVKGPEPASLKFSISHSENGVEIQDAQFDDTSSCLAELRPGVEYDITYSLSNWMDGTEQKTLKCKVIKQGVISTEIQTQAAASSASSTSSEQNPGQSPIINSVAETANTSIDESKNTSINETAADSVNESENEKDNASKLIVLALFVVILVGAAVVVVVILSKKKQKQA